VGAVNVGTASATIEWTGADNGGSAITSYNVSGGSGCSTDGNGSFCEIGGLSAGSSYVACVTATNAAGTGPQACVSFGTAPPPSYGEVNGVTITAIAVDSNPNEGGPTGQQIPIYSTVQVSCRTTGANANGDVWWYHIASGLDAGFWVSADNFWNTGTNTSGPFNNGILVDTNVPLC
jgi:hypothetical protein